MGETLNLRACLVIDLLYSYNLVRASEGSRMMGGAVASIYLYLPSD